MKIKQKLILGYLAIATATGLVGVVAYKSMETISQDFQAVSEGTLPTTSALKDLQNAGAKIIASTSEYIAISARTKVLTPTPAINAALLEEEEEVKEGFLKYDLALNQYKSIPENLSADKKSTLTQIQSAGESLKANSLKLIEVQKLSANPLKFFEQKEEFEESEDKFYKAVDIALNAEEPKLTTLKNEVQAAIVYGRNILLTASIFTFAVAGIIGIVLSTSIIRRLQELVTASELISQGKLDVQLPLPQNDELGQLNQGFAVMRDQLESTFNRLEDTVEERTELLLIEQTRLQKKLTQERLVFGIVGQIRQSLNNTDICNSVTADIRSAFACDRVAIFQFNDQNFGTYIAESVGQGNETRSNGTLHSFSAEVQAFQSGLDHTSVQDLELICSRLSMPIFNGEQLWGILVAFDYHQPSRSWTESEIAIATAVCLQLGISIKQNILLSQHASQNYPL